MSADNTNSEYKTFKVSDLSSISDISHDDLLLISDYEGGKCYSRKMNLAQLMTTIASDSIISAEVQNTSSPVSQAIQRLVSAFVLSEVERIVNDGLSAKILQTISANSDFVWDAMDGVIDKKNVIDGGFSATNSD